MRPFVVVYPSSRITPRQDVEAIMARLMSSSVGCRAIPQGIYQIYQLICIRADRAISCRPFPTVGASMCGAGRTRTHKAASTARLFGTGAAGLSASRSRAESEIRTPEALVTPYTVSNGAPRAVRTISMRGRRADRTPAGLAPRPPVSNRVPYQLGQPSVRREGLAPSRPFRDTGF